MRGRRVLMDSFVSHGVRHIFGNPGTTETPLLDSLPVYPEIDYVMTLHESVAVTAASFYAQASGRVTVANLHVAPGLGNGIGSIYGALKTNSPVVVTAGQQDTRMRLRNPVLAHDLVAMAAPVTKWSVQVERADEIAPILRRAFKVATDAPQGPVFVSFTTYMSPLWATGLGVLFLGEQLHWSMIGALGLILAGVAVATVEPWTFSTGGDRKSVV